MINGVIAIVQEVKLERPMWYTLFPGCFEVAYGGGYIIPGYLYKCLENMLITRIEENNQRANGLVQRSKMKVLYHRPNYSLPSAAVKRHTDCPLRRNAQGFHSRFV